MALYVFPGQGSQKKGMGGELFDQVKWYAEVEKDVDDILGYSLRRQCLDDSDGRLKLTQFTQPCLYVVNALHYHHGIGERPAPSFLAGHSLGEYNALLAAGAFDFLTGLKLVKRRGELMAEAKGGGMAAVVGLDPLVVEQVIADEGLLSIDVANFNSARQTVISGPVDDVQRAAGAFERAGAQMYVPLQVSAAFHSRYMVAASDAFDQFLQGFTFQTPQVPVIANVTARPYPAGNPSIVLRSILSRQITQSVLWAQSIRYVLAQGETDFQEFGPGTVLTKLIADIRGQSAQGAAQQAA